jgi:hypothetical protein
MRRTAIFVLSLSVLLANAVSSAPPAGALPLKTQVTYVVSPHPDDEFEAWSLVQNSTANFEIFVVLTHGEQTVACDHTGAWLDPGEIPPPVGNPGRGSLGCGVDRIASHRVALNNQANYDTALSPLTVLTLATSTTPLGGCSPNSTGYEVWQGNGSNAELIFDIGDGRVTPACVHWAVQTARGVKASLVGASSLPDFAVIGASYYSTSAGCKNYVHADHKAVFDDLTTTNEGAPHQWTSICGTANWSGATRAGTITDLIWTANMEVVAPNVAVGNMQQSYGWQFPGNLDNGSETGFDLSGGPTVLYQKAQTFAQFV